MSAERPRPERPGAQAAVFVWMSITGLAVAADALGSFGRALGFVAVATGAWCGLLGVVLVLVEMRRRSQP